MQKRIIEIGTPSRLSVSHRQLVIDSETSGINMVSIEDLGVLILDHPITTFTQAVLRECARNNVAVIVCDDRHLPYALSLPLADHQLHAKTLRLQIEATEPVKKRTWQAIVKAKVRTQAQVLKMLHGNSDPLPAYADKVKSGDPDNIEAQAARIYWPRLFGETFRRNPDGDGVNSLLNYGYAIIRAALARALVGAGLHPGLGIHHDNQYNAYALADDLIEPLRPLVDLRVAEWIVDHDPEINRHSKEHLLQMLSWSIALDGQKIPLMVATHYYAASLRRVLAGSDKKLEIPSM